MVTLTLLREYAGLEAIYLLRPAPPPLECEGPQEGTGEPAALAAGQTRLGAERMGQSSAGLFRR